MGLFSAYCYGCVWHFTFILSQGKQEMQVNLEHEAKLKNLLDCKISRCLQKNVLKLTGLELLGGFRHITLGSSRLVELCEISGQPLITS